MYKKIPPTEQQSTPDANSSRDNSERQFKTQVFTASPVEHGLSIERVFSTDGQHPFDSVQWAKRDAVIKNHTGEAIFEQREVEFPTTWSQLASNVVASKYFYGDLSQAHAVIVSRSNNGSDNPLCFDITITDKQGNLLKFKTT